MDELEKELTGIIFLFIFNVNGYGRHGYRHDHVIVHRHASDHRMHHPLVQMVQIQISQAAPGPLPCHPERDHVTIVTSHYQFAMQHAGYPGDNLHEQSLTGPREVLYSPLQRTAPYE